MNGRIIWKMPDGSIRITSPVEKKPDSESMKDYLDRIADKARPDPLAERSNLTKADLPGKKLFRASWRLVNEKVVVNMPLARIEKLNRIRTDRNKRLADSDGMMFRANETGQKVTEWKAYRKSLRDVPTSFDLSTITDERLLHEFNPSWPTEPDA